MSSPPAPQKPRPLSPHLQVYRPQLTSSLSIFHRMTGIALSLGMPIFVLWLVALMKGGKTYECFSTCAHSIVGTIFLMGWIWSFTYHLCTGVRHLLWDTGRFLEIKQVYRTGYIALTISTLVTVALWYKLLAVHS